MPLQNRVNPFGELFRTDERGTMMGNRGGVLHNGHREIVSHFKNRRWITCVLTFKGRQRVVMSEGLYTELFFLDEAVAFGAGHRPCAECRRARFNAFRDAWQKRSGLDRRPMADEMDMELHAARLEGKRTKVTYDAALRALPDGTFIEVGGSAYLLWKGAQLLWSADGYGRREMRSKDEIVRVLTPRPIVECFEQGYEPAVHETATRWTETVGAASV